MTHIMIEDSPEGKWLLELIRNHKSVTVVGEKDAKQAKAGAWDTAIAEGAVSVDAFFNELDARIDKWPDSRA